MRSLALVLCLLSSTAYADTSINKLGVVFHLVPHNHKPEWTWTPSISFKIHGPLASSSNLSIEYTYPNGKPWLKAACEVSALAETEKLQITDCGFRQEDTVATNQTGVFGFTVKLVDPLAGSTKSLFAGKFTVGKQVYNPTKSPTGAKQFYYYVDQDWRLPIGFVGSWKGDISNDLYAETWIKGPVKDTSTLKGYLFYGGKQVAETSGSEILRATPPDTPQWEYRMIRLQFPALTEKPYADSTYYKLYENPGTYEVKMLRDGKLVRTMKFTIEGGKPKDTGVAATNGFPPGAMILVNVLDGDGSWRKDAWKTEAFFANPVKGL
jgi:hypothetical protein